MHAVTIVDGAARVARAPRSRARRRASCWSPCGRPGVSSADLLQRAGHLPSAARRHPARHPRARAGGRGRRRSVPAPPLRASATASWPSWPAAGQAERVVVHERVAIPVPDAVAWDQAGGFPENVTTAHDALFTQCGLGMGERLLVHGAAGGVGTAAVAAGRRRRRARWSRRSATRPRRVECGRARGDGRHARRVRRPRPLRRHPRARRRPQPRREPASAGHRGPHRRHRRGRRLPRPS